MKDSDWLRDIAEDTGQLIGPFNKRHRLRDVADRLDALERVAREACIHTMRFETGSLREALRDLNALEADIARRAALESDTEEE